MIDLSNGRHHHLISKALAIAIIAIESAPPQLRATSDAREMKHLLQGMLPEDASLEVYIRSAARVVNGEILP